MADFVFANSFLNELAEFEITASARDRELLDRVLAVIANNPQLAGRMPSFYDPTAPTYLYRSGHLLIHYRETDSGDTEFLNLFWPKV